MFRPMEIVRVKIIKDALGKPVLGRILNIYENNTVKIRVFKAINNQPICTLKLSVIEKY